MSWSDAKADAELRAAEILRLMEGAPRGVDVPLSFYPTPHDYRTLRPGEEWSWEHYAAVVRAVARIIRRTGHKARLVNCTAADCLAWLDAQGLPSNPGTRAQYVATVTRA